MLGIPLTLTDPSFWAGVPPVNAAGQIVTSRTALTLSTVWACTRLISETIGTLPLHLYERTKDGRRLASEHPLATIIQRQPNVDSTASTYWESVVATMLLHGNGFSRKLRVGNRVVGLKFLSCDRVTIRKLADGLFQLYYTENNGSQVYVPNEDLFRVTGFSLDGKWGLSAISYGAAVFGSALASGTAANTTFEKGLSPTVAFTMDRVLTSDQRKEFRENMKEVAGALNAGRSPLLEGGMKAEAIGINPKDAQLLESRAFSVEEICRWFGVDPSLVGHGTAASNWGTGLEQKMIAFLIFTLRPYLTRIEQAINTSLIDITERHRYYAEFSIEGLLRADSAGRSAFYREMVNNGIFTRDEVRRLENLPTMGGNAGKLTVQSAMIPIDDIGNQNKQ